MSNYSAAHQHLMLEVIDAVESGKPHAKISTPGWKQHTATLDDVLTDQFAGASDPVLPGLIDLFAAAFKSSDPVMRLKAQALASQFAKAHADFHAADALDGLQVLEDLEA